MGVSFVGVEGSRRLGNQPLGPKPGDRARTRLGPGRGSRRRVDLGRFISDETRDYLRMLARVSSMGIAMVLATVMGFGLGYWVDGLWGGFTAPWGKLVGLVIGIVAGYRNIYIIMKRSKYL